MNSFDLLGFAARMVEVTVAVDEAQRSALKEVAELVESSAKESLGTYQGAAGPFGAWPSLAQATQDDRVAKGYSADEPLLRDGTLRDSIGHKVDAIEAVIGSDLPVAEYQELGTSKIPPRSFLDSAAVRETDRIVDTLGRYVVGALVGEAVLGGRKSIT